MEGALRWARLNCAISPLEARVAMASSIETETMIVASVWANAKAAVKICPPRGTSADTLNTSPVVGATVWAFTILCTSSLQLNSL